MIFLIRMLLPALVHHRRTRPSHKAHHHRRIHPSAKTIPPHDEVGALISRSELAPQKQTMLLKLRNQRSRQEACNTQASSPLVARYSHTNDSYAAHGRYS